MAGYGGYGGYGYGAGYDMAGYGNSGAYHTNDRYPAPAQAAYEDPLAGRRQHDFPAPLTGLEFQPSDTCPKNYVIFDQTYDRSTIMYNPSLANNSGGYAYDQHCNNGGYDQNYVGKSTYYDGSECSIRQEDPDEIDALVSSGDGEDDDDDVLSTGHSGASPDSTCSSGGKRKKQRVKKMMKTLKGIVPGGDRMDTPAVLDEAVRYLKSLKLGAKKAGARGSRS